MRTLSAHKRLLIMTTKVDADRKARRPLVCPLTCCMRHVPALVRNAISFVSLVSYGCVAKDLQLQWFSACASGLWNGLMQAAGAQVCHHEAACYHRLSVDHVLARHLCHGHSDEHVWSLGCTLSMNGFGLPRHAPAGGSASAGMTALACESLQSCSVDLRHLNQWLAWTSHHLLQRLVHLQVQQGMMRYALHLPGHAEEA